MPGTKQIFETDYKKPLIGKLSRVVEHPHNIPNLIKESLVTHDRLAY